MTAAMAHAGASDCERCRDGWVGQPVNAVSSLAYVAAGARVLRGARSAPTAECLVGVASVATGLGSVAFHGPGGARSQRLHDASLVALLLSLGVAGIVRVPSSRVPLVGAAIAAGAAVASHPRWSATAQAGAGALAVVGEAVRLAGAAPPSSEPPTGRNDAAGAAGRRATAPLAAVGAAAHLLGGTGGPLCRPDSVLQPHALWHVLTAAAIALRA